MSVQKSHTKSDIFLGNKIQTIRIKQGQSLLQVGKKVNELYQQIDKFENGARIPVSKLEEIAQALDIFIQKKLIRKIVKFRKFQTKEAQEQLIILYDEALSYDEI